MHPSTPQANGTPNSRTAPSTSWSTTGGLQTACTSVPMKPPPNALCLPFKGRLQHSTPTAAKCIGHEACQHCDTHTCDRQRCPLVHTPALPAATAEPLAKHTNTQTLLHWSPKPLSVSGLTTRRGCRNPPANYLSSGHTHNSMHTLPLSRPRSSAAAAAPSRSRRIRVQGRLHLPAVRHHSEVAGDCCPEAPHVLLGAHNGGFLACAAQYAA